MQRNTRIALLKILVISLVFLSSAPTFSEATPRYQIDIPAQNVEQALRNLANVTNSQLLFPYELVEPLQSTAVAGRYTLQRALNQLLKSTPLSGELTEDGVILVMRRAQHGDKGEVNMNNKINARKTLLATFITMFAAGATAQGVDSDQQAATQQNQIDEIIVTASKRGAGQSIQDTAMAISALSGDTIEKRGLVGMDDYLRSLPGVSMQDRGAGQNHIIIRGLTADPQADGSSESTAGIYFGETSLSGLGSSSAVGGKGNPDIKLVDIERIEVLRGPQGTLYGSGSMGGTVRIIPASANLTEVEGKLATSFSKTGEEGGNNTMIQGVLNLPLIEDKLAVRAVAYQFDNSGYMQNVASSQPVTGAAATQGFGGVANDRDDVGNDSYTGFRITSLWRPIEALDITLSYLQQEIEQDGTPEIDLGLTGDYQQRRFNTGEAGSNYEFLNNDIDVTNLVFNYDLDWGSVTSSSSWVDYTSSIETDVTHIMWLFLMPDQPFFSGVEGSGDIFSQELRLSSELSGPVQFMTGIYYEDREIDSSDLWEWSGDPLLEPGFILSALDITRSTKQKAVFGELSYTVTEQLTATVGGRYFDYESAEISTQTFFGFPGVTPTDIAETGQTYKANLSYTPNEDMLIYGQWAEGFRLGRGQSSNPTCTAAGFPSQSQIDSDTSENFELGFKSSLAEGRVILNAALYQVDWEGIPVVINPAPGCLQTVNAGKAKSEGVELEMQARLTENLSVDVSASYGESTMTEDADFGGGVVVEKGDNLPGSSDFNASLAIQYDFTLANNETFIRVDYSYISDYYSSFDESGLAVGGFGLVNLKAGMEFDDISVDIFANNLANNDGLTWVDSVNGIFGTLRANRIRPRSIGLNLRYQF